MRCGPRLPLYGAEPAGADDAARSLAAGRRVASVVPDTVCDGLRALIGEPNLQALREHAVQVVTVTDAETIAAMRLLWQELKLVVEVSSRHRAGRGAAAARIASPAGASAWC